LRAGDIWLEGSRRYANPATYLIPPDRWEGSRSDVCARLKVPIDGSVRLAKRQVDLEEVTGRVNHALPSSDKVRVEKGKFVITSLKAEERPKSSEELEQCVTALLPRVDLADLLIEVDSWTHFTKHFEHAGGSEPRAKDLLTHIYAAILAQSSNLGPSQMAPIADLSYSRLAWCNTWYLREETLRKANTAIVNFHHKLPLSQRWGGGTLSSSDGQRFPVSVKARNATANSRYFGRGKGLTSSTWTSNQFSQYGTKIVPTSVRDATYVLDEILGNETELSIVEHTTDTAGYTDLVFALFDLLDMRFSPRIRDLGDQRLYRMDRTTRYQNLDPLMKKMINQELILRHWDDMLRVAGSLKSGWVTASLFISKLQAPPRKNALARALQEYGRLVKTIFIFRYLESEEYRRMINTQLNKGEALHSLRRFLYFANQGIIRLDDEESQTTQAMCLTLVTNAVVTWNTVYMAAALDGLRSQGHVVDADIPHLWPSRHEHVNPYGKYRFNVEDGLKRKDLRPLRGN
jgi:TnpA family transposase